MRLLLVEDERRLAQSLRRGFEEEGHVVDLANDGKEAVDLGTMNEYDVIVLDILLPRKNGLVVCRELREARVTTPLLMLTARDSVAPKIVGINTGADDYLTKPFVFSRNCSRASMPWLAGGPLTALPSWESRT